MATVRGDTRTLRSNLRVMGYCFVVGLGATAFGFDQAETGGFLAMNSWIRDFGQYDPKLGTYVFSAQRSSAMYGLELAFILLSALVCGSIGSRYGQRIGLCFCAVTGLIGSALMMPASYASQMVGRLFMGMAIGACGTFAITYWSEAAPVHLRGIVVIFYQFFISVPNFIGSCIDEGTHNLPDAWAYRGPLLTTMLCPILLLIFIWFVPQSPRWLVTKDRREEARTAIRKFRGKDIPQDELDQEMKEAIAFTEMERQLERSSTYLDCFRGTDFRRYAIGAFLMSGQQMMGVGFLAAYATYFFALVGLKNAFVVSVITSALQIVGCFTAFFTVQYIGRRTLLLWGAVINGISMLGFAAVAESKSSHAAPALIMFICLFTFCYSATWGSVCPIILGEVPSNNLRAKSVALSLATSWAWALTIIVSTPYLLSADYANLGPRLGYVFGGLTVIVFVCTFLYVPETKGRTLEEIDEMFINKVPPRQFKTYVCTGQIDGVDVVNSFGDEKVMTVQIEHKASDV